MNIKMHPVAPPMPQPIPQLALSRVSPWQRWLNGNLVRLGLWFGFQAALGYGCKVSVVTTIHAYLTVAIALWAALLARKREYALYAMAYIVGSEVLWRMGNAQIFWEFGKYAVLVIAATTMLRYGLFRHPGLPLTYFVLLLPSVVLPLANLEELALQQTISFYLSGPLALAVCYWLGSNLKITREQALQCCLFLLGPVISIATRALASILQAQDIFFGSSSNHLASGGYGPNQVSSTFGLGIVATLLYTALEKRERWLKILLGILLVWLTAQCVLTFSRTGLYLAALSGVIGASHLLRDRRARLKLILTALFFGGSLFFLLPQLERFTQGALSKRFSNLSTTGRDELALQELEVWYENPIFGVGPGMSGSYREGIMKGVLAHMEYSRMLAEHGIFGLIAIGLMLALAVRNMRQAQTPAHRAFVFALLTWSILFMFSTAMRTAAPAFLFGLTAIRWRDEKPAG